MSDDVQKKVFSRNLSFYVSSKEKTQKEIADAIGVSTQTFNTWMRGIALPRMGKVQLLADYFGIQKSDLIEDKSDQDTFPPLTAAEENHMRKYRKLSDVDQIKVDERIDTLLEEEREELKRVSAS